MSSSEGIRLVVRSSPASDLAVSDSRFRIVAMRNGRLDVELSPGSYALRVSEAGVARYTDFVLRAGGGEFAIDVAPTAFASSAPLDHTSTTHEWHRYPAIDRSREIPQE